MRVESPVVTISDTVPARPHSQRVGWPLWAMLTLNTLVCVLLGYVAYAYQLYPFDGDEVNHALPSLQMALAIEQGDFSKLLNLISFQSFYPPAMEVVKALAFVAFAPSFLLARIFSLACLFGANVMIFAICTELDERWGDVAGLIAIMLVLTSRPILVNSILSMSEIPSLLACLMFLWLYIRALKHPSPRRLLFTSLALVLVFLTKYTYGISAVVTLFATEATRLLLPPKASRTMADVGRRWLYLLGPFLLAMTLWFLHPTKLSGFFNYTQPLAEEEAWLSLANVDYYLRSLVIHDLPAPMFALVTLAGCVWALSQWRRVALRPLLFFFLFGLGMIMVVNHPVNPRFIAVFVVAAHILTALMLMTLVARWLQRRRLDATALFLGVVGLILLLSVPNTLRRWSQMDEVFEVMVESDPAINEMQAWIEAQVPAGSTIMMINYWDQFDPHLYDWYDAVDSIDGQAPPAEGVLLDAPTAAAKQAMRARIVAARPDYVLLFEGGMWGHPFWPEYTEALHDLISPVARGSFEVQSFETAKDWLDTQSIADENWPEVRAESLTTLPIEVIVFEVDALE